MEKDCSKEKDCAKIEAVNELNRFYELHVEINREQGSILALQDETERLTRSSADRARHNFAKIKDLRHSVSAKQRELQKLAEKVGMQINQLFN